MPPASISFDNTEYAFAYKSDAELKKAHFLFSTMQHAALVRIGVWFTPWAIKLRLPVRGLIRSTIFAEFVGGETLEKTAAVVSKLSQFNVQVILDYGVEGKADEQHFDHAKSEFLRVIQYAASQANIPFMSIKVTGLARFELLEALHANMTQFSGPLLKRYLQACAELSAEQKLEWERVHARLLAICETAAACKVGVLIDAEETWIQDPVDALAQLMMESYNRSGFVTVYNTVQLYRHDRLAFLRASVETATERKFLLGVKLVRGAYLEKERKRAAEQGYPSPIQADKISCDRDYDAAVNLCIEQIAHTSLIVASHNEASNLNAVHQLQLRHLPLSHPHVFFSQLYGMSDNITFNLARAGCRVSKYLPFGPLTDVVPYLMRRAQENSSMSGQSGRELGLIQKELRRRSG